MLRMIVVLNMSLKIKFAGTRQKTFTMGKTTEHVRERERGRSAVFAKYAFVAAIYVSSITW